MKIKKLSWRARRVFKAFPSSGSLTTESLVNLYNQLYGMPKLVLVLGVAKMLKLPMTVERMNKILAGLMVRGLVSAETVFEQELYTLTKAGETSKQK